MLTLTSVSFIVLKERKCLLINTFFLFLIGLGKPFHELKKYEKDIEKTSLQSQRTKFPNLRGRVY